MEFSTLNAQAESLLKSILKMFDGNEYSFVKVPIDNLPATVKPNVDQLSRELQKEDLISSYQLRTNNELFAVLTSKALEYFDDRKKDVVHEMMFRKLPKNSEQLLEKILDLESQDQNVAQVLDDNLKSLSDKQRGILVNILKELENYNLIEFTWEGQNLINAQLKKLGRSYFDRKEKYYNAHDLPATTVPPQPPVPVNQMQADSVAEAVADVRQRRLDLLGDDGAEEEPMFTGQNQPDPPLFMQPQVPAQKQMPVDIYGYLDSLAEQRGGADTEQLKQLIEDVGEFLELLKFQKTVPDNPELWDKLQVQFQKHPWFLGEITQLVGREVLALLPR